MVMSCIDLQHHVDSCSVVNFYTDVIQKNEDFFSGMTAFISALQVYVKDAFK